MMTGLKTKLICFLPVYLLFSDFPPVSLLGFLRALTILVCSLSHMPNQMDQSGSREVVGVTLGKMGFSVEMLSCLHLLGSAVSVARGSI